MTLYSPTAYPNLFNTIGYNYGGSGNGNTISFDYTSVGTGTYLYTWLLTIDYQTRDIYVVATTVGNGTGTKYLARFTSSYKFVSVRTIGGISSESYAVREIVASGGRVVIACGGSEVTYTANDGETWTRLTANEGGVKSQLCASAEAVYVIGYSGGGFLQYWYMDSAMTTMKSVISYLLGVQSSTTEFAVSSNGPSAFVYTSGSGQRLVKLSKGTADVWSIPEDKHPNGIKVMPFIDGKYYFTVNNVATGSLNNRIYVYAITSGSMTLISNDPLAYVNNGGQFDYTSTILFNCSSMILGDCYTVCELYESGNTTSPKNVRLLAINPFIRKYSVLSISPVTGVSTDYSVYVSEPLDGWIYYNTYRILATAFRFQTPLQELNGCQTYIMA